MNAFEWVVLGLLCVTLVLLVRVSWRQRQIVAGPMLERARVEVLSVVAVEVQKFIEANAVLALAEQFQDRPEFATHAKQYSYEVVVAALTYRVTILDGVYRAFEDNLAAHRLKYPVGDGHINDLVREVEAALTRLQAARVALVAYTRAAERAATTPAGTS